MKINYTRENFPSNARFLRVTCEDGDFYAAVNNRSQIRELMRHYTECGYTVSVVRRSSVPACVFQYFDVPGLVSSRESKWNNGTQIYF